MRKVVSLQVILVALVGCATGGNPFPADKALVNDVSVSAALDSGYRVSEVDGVPAQRAYSGVVTVVPYVVLTAGEHTLAVESRSGNSLPTAEVTATFEAGKRYRLERKANALLVVEDEK